MHRGDPFEEVNRTVTQFNLALDDFILRPLARVYRTYLPQFMRSMIHNFTANLGAPVTLANDLLQGNLHRAHGTTTRFVMNSTLGFAGLYDIASRFGVHPHTEDFGQTFAVWGAPRGPFLVLPVVGPMNTRHAVGTILDIAASPWTWTTPSTFRIAVTVTNVVDVRAQKFGEINDLIDETLDFYAASKSLYHQNRTKLIENGNTVSRRSEQGARSH